jgi:hypothetical protein
MNAPIVGVGRAIAIRKSAGWLMFWLARSPQNLNDKRSSILCKSHIKDAQLTNIYVLHVASV